ncbi:cysteine dioxygenase type I [Teratosphaeria nubilosa]|uniref:Cysteine dioxygenase n=1 Tax=Teratosphaeria nubilosa TaxID=161662 RepID=A0A6G1KTG8_9PEZI|nr:cysteine dioxygenase type I [Teratosphaeria nubilosa]
MSTPNKPEITGHDSARGSPEPRDTFHALVDQINDILGPTNGIDSEGVDVEEIKAVMRGYDSNEVEWNKYAFEDYSRAYTRNLVDHGNGKSNLLVLVWTPGKASPIHDHANAHCVMKILKGRLTETIYGFPCQRSKNAPDCATSPTSSYPSTTHTCSSNPDDLTPHALVVKRKTMYKANEVTYMSDQIGLHRIENPDLQEVAVSLHLYTPPNAAKFGCHIFDERTGRKKKALQCHFYSELGVKM